MTGNRRENRRQPTLEELEKRTGKQRSGETEETEETEETKEQGNKGAGKQRKQRNWSTEELEKHIFNSQKQGTGKAAIQFSGI